MTDRLHSVEYARRDRRKLARYRVELDARRAAAAHAAGYGSWWAMQDALARAELEAGLRDLAARESLV